jgi:hypothetical protein
MVKSIRFPSFLGLRRFKKVFFFPLSSKKAPPKKYQNNKKENNEPERKFDSRYEN